MIVGFTGTREGMTWKQGLKVRDFIYEYLHEDGDEFHHGDCLGADQEAHDIAVAVVRIVIHPPSDPKLQAFCGNAWILREKPYLERNRDIVDACDYLVAAPKQRTRLNGGERGGGTWYTIRYAEKIGKPVTIVYPDGTTERRNAAP